MERDNLLLILALVAVFSAIGTSVYVYQMVGPLLGTLTGFATTGDANLTIPATVLVNFTNGSIAWGEGIVTGSRATLDTLGFVDGGNWSNVSAGFLVENQGNGNVTLDLSAGKTAANYVGGTSPVYQWNLTNREAESCTFVEQNATEHFFNDTTTVVTRVCSVFNFIDGQDLLHIDVNISFADDTATGVKSDVLTVVATAA